MDGGNQKPTNEEQAIAQVSYPKKLAVNDGRRVCATAIPLLVPSGNRRQILALFENRVSWSGYRHWRAGRRGMPEWALTALETKLHAYWCEYARVADTIAAAAPSPGKGWNKGAARGLGEWRAKQNLGKREP